MVVRIQPFLRKLVQEHKPSREASLVLSRGNLVHQLKTIPTNIPHPRASSNNQGSDHHPPALTALDPVGLANGCQAHVKGHPRLFFGLCPHPQAWLQRGEGNDPHLGKGKCGFIMSFDS